MLWFRKGPSSSSEKMFSSERLWKWAKGVIKWTAGALFNVLVTVWEWVVWASAYVSEKVWTKDERIMEMKRGIREHHARQLKKSWSKAFSWVLDAGKWLVNTVLWGVWTIASTVKDNYNSLKKEDETKKDDGKKSASKEKSES